VSTIPLCTPGERGKGAAAIGKGAQSFNRDGIRQSSFPISALTGEGIDALLAALGERVARNYRSEAPVLTRARHRQALEEAASSLSRSLTANLTELRGEDLRLALRSLGHITGTVDVEELLDVIFRDFCIGK